MNRRIIILSVCGAFGMRSSMMLKSSFVLFPSFKTVCKQTIFHALSVRLGQFVVGPIVIHFDSIYFCRRCQTQAKMQNTKQCTNLLWIRVSDFLFKRCRKTRWAPFLIFSLLWWLLHSLFVRKQFFCVSFLSSYSRALHKFQFSFSRIKWIAISTLSTAHGTVDTDIQPKATIFRYYCYYYDMRQWQLCFYALNICHINFFETLSFRQSIRANIYHVHCIQIRGNSQEMRLVQLCIWIIMHIFFVERARFWSFWTFTKNDIN